MERVALPFPVVPGKDPRAIAETFLSRPDEYAESRRKKGISLERAYLQTTPMGNFVVGYFESERSFAEANAELATSDLAIDRYFVEAVRDIHGIDLTEPPQGPAPETIGYWSDPNVTTRGRGMAFTAPILPGTEDRGREFIQDAFSRPGMTESRRRLKQHLEVVTLIQTPQGPVIAAYLEGADPFQANRDFAASTETFDVWFKDQLRTLTPPFIDFSEPVPGVTEIFDSEKLLARA